ncbi:MAG TPA: DUF2905 domain-containing protein [Ideonella sp.]|uniref:DUF2905 domain-containing protein n=1 Tax=Ideonella sp. TaxID=1929293 RepID=UPI002B8489DF|nr:DUF2905 domain-containing protein [Ideonella sp.]HSI50114.1 DUF2905 domain-containing protein [Ideonella sp.]
MRWLIVLLLICLIFNRAGDWLQKLGLGRLPGDVRFRIFGRQIFLPFASCILLSLVASGVMMVL